MDSAPWHLQYDPPRLLAGPRAVNELEDALETMGVDRALVICGQTVGNTPEVMEPLKNGLGSGFVDVFAETTPAKRFATVAAAARRARELHADVLVGVGGGSSLDVTRLAAILTGAPGTPADHEQTIRTGALPNSEHPPATVLLPTTLAGAALSSAAGVTWQEHSGDEGTAGVGLSSPDLRATLVCSDATLSATTPRQILINSALNGFNKGVETLYSRYATPITDATAMRGIGLLATHLPALRSDPLSATTLGPILTGSLLVQYGCSRENLTTLSILHAFGHALTRTYPLQQGEAHAIVTPAVLEYLFEEVDGRRSLIARGLDCEAAPDPANAIVDRIVDLRDGLGLPRALQEVDGPEPVEFPEIARAVLADPMMANAPSELAPTERDIEGVLEAVY